MPPDSIADFGMKPNTFMNDICFTHCTQAGLTDDAIQSYFKCVGVCVGVCLNMEAGLYNKSLSLEAVFEYDTKAFLIKVYARVRF